MIPKLLPDSHPLLHKRMPRYDFTTGDATDIASTLIESMTYYEGIGLAANQIGIETAAFAIETSWAGPIVLFNPLVTWLSLDTIMLDEGCLSFPALELKIKRPKACQLEYQDQNQRTQVLNLTGIECRAALHEIDHLLGVTFTEKVSRLRLSMAKKKIK